LQIKTGASYFRPNGDDFVFYGELRHLEYWTRHSLLVFLILHDPDRNLTVWQKVERRLANVTKKGWSIVVPSANVLEAASKTFISDGIANDDESIRRFNMAYDFDTIEALHGKEVYFEVNEWVNKSLKFRDVGVYYGDHGKHAPDFMIRMRVPAPTLDDFMRNIFPWLDYECVRAEEKAGEVEVHVLQVWVNELGKSYLCVEQYFKDGPLEREEPEILEHEESAADEEDDASWMRRAIERDQS